MDEDDELAWKALEVPPPDARHGAQHHHHPHHAGAAHEEDDEDDTDVDAFAPLSYAPSSSTSSSAAAASGVSGVNAGSGSTVLGGGRSSSAARRFKRKNFSKQLQLICLQRYAAFARQQGKLPDKPNCQLLLQESYLQFIKEGGAVDEPQLSYADFLKLIRNRRREMYMRVQNPPKYVDPRHSHGLTPAKRKLQQEHAKIHELIEIIDQAREQSGLVQEVRQHHQSPRQLVDKHVDELPPPPDLVDPQDQINAIFHIYEQTRAIQSEITERLEAIQRHRLMLRHHDSMEPSSASV